MQRLYEYGALLLTCAAAITLVGLQLEPLGWTLLALATMVLPGCRPGFAKNVLLVNISLGILGLAPIETDIHAVPALTMATVLTGALMLPYLVSRYIYKDRLIRFTFRGNRPWRKKEVAYIGLAAVLSYLILPYYLKSTGAYLNWPAVESAGEIFKLFIGTNALGIWDELFFICVTLGILRRYFSFWQANLAQAILFTSFLYELGFTAWAFIPIYIFALLQGYIFSKTESLLYVITIHLTVDLFLFLALLNAHNPALVPIFIT